MNANFRFGVEEEYFLVDRATGAARCDPPSAFWADLKRNAPTATKEMLQSQVEAATAPCETPAQCLAEMIASRAAIDDVARAHGLGLIAAGTHPDFDWRESRVSRGDRYARLARDMRMLASRNMFCGLHVHVEAPDPSARITLMNRCGPFLPLFLALSVSSPFWRGQWTGMRGYRLTGYDELPRTGLPPVFADDAEYRRFADALKGARAVADESYLWWAIRPSLRYPTLELRICDSVTDVRAAVAIASLYRCLIRRLARDAGFGPAPSPMLRAIAEENRWQIQCDGLDATIVDVVTLEPVDVRSAIRALLTALAPDAEALDVVPEFDRIGGILEQGTSADRQIALYYEALDAGASEAAALERVLSWLLDASLEG